MGSSPGGESCGWELSGWEFVLEPVRWLDEMTPSAVNMG